MRDERKTKAQLIEELHQMRARVAELENPESSRENQDKYRLLIEQADVGMIVIQDGKHVLYNHSFLEIVGYNAEDYKNVDFATSIHPDDRQIALDRIQQRLTGTIANPDSLEIRIVTKTGQVKWISANSVSIQWGGKPAVLAFVIDVTERRQAEEALEKSGKDYRTLFETMAQGVVYQNASGEIISANPSAQRILGLTLDEMQGRTSIDPRWRAIHEDGSDFPGETHPAMVALQTGEPVSNVIMGVFNPIDDDYRWMIVNAIPEFLPGEEKPYRVYTTSDDITERKRAEDILQESEQRYRHLFEEMVSGFALHEIVLGDDGKPCDYRFLEINPAFERLTGLKSDDVVGKNVLEVLPGTESYWIEVGGHVALTGESAHLEQYSQEFESYYDVFFYCPRPGQFAVTFTDVTERKHAEEAIRESEEKFRTLYDSMLEGVCLHELIYNDSQEPIDYRILDINPKYEEILALKREDVVNKSAKEVYSVNESPYLEIYAEVVQTGKSAQFETYFPPMDKHFSISVFRIGKDRFATYFDDITERKQAENSLQENEEKYRLLFESTNDLITLADATAKTILANPAWENVFGSVEEYSEDPFEMIHPEDREQVGLAWDNLLNDRIPSANLEYRYLTKWDEYLYFETMVHAVNLAGEKRFYVVAHNVTERKRSEAALELQKLYFQRLFEGSLDAIAMVDAEDRVLQVNHAFKTIFGYSQDEVRDHVLNDVVVPPDRRAEGIDLSLRVMEGESVRLETLRQRKDGSLVNVEILGYPTFIGDTAEGAYVIYRDISERKQAEEALRESNERLSSTLASMDDLVFVLDRDGCYVDYCQPYDRPGLFVSPETFLGRTFQETMPPHVSELITTAITELKTTCSVQKIEYDLETPDGIRSFSANISMKKDAHGEFEGAVAVVRDITEQRQAEESLIQSEVRFRELFENMSSGVAVYEVINDGEDFVFKDFNRASEIIENVDREEIIGKRVTEAFPGVKDFGILDVFKRVWKTGEPEHHPMSFYEDDRLASWRENYVYRLRSGEIVAIYDDQTQRKRAEEALRSSEEKYRILFNNAVIAITIVDVSNWQISMINTAGTRTLGGVKPDELIGKTLPEILPDPELGRRMKARLESVADTGTGIQFEDSMVSPAGETIWFKCNIRPMRDGDGNIYALLSLSENITERRQAEQLLLLEKNFFESLVSSLPGMFYCFDSEGRFLRWNNNFESATGYTAEEIARITPVDLFEGDEKEYISRRIEDVFVQGQAEAEAVLVSKNGDKAPYYFTGAQVDILGETCLVGMGIDITDRHQAEQALRESEEKYRLIAENTGDLITLTDIAGRYTYLSPSFVDILGYNIDELIGTVGDAYVHPDDMQHLIDSAGKLYDPEYINELLNTNQKSSSVTLEYRIQDAWGNWHYIETVINLIIDHQGKEHRVIHVARDITERKQAEAILHEREEMINAIVETSRDWIWALDRQGRHTYSNPAIETILGYQTQEIIGKSPFDFMDEANRAEGISMLTKSVSKKQGWNDLLLEWRHKNGDHRFLESNAVPILDDAGYLHGFRGIDRDVTERQQAEEALKESEEKFRTISEQALMGICIIQENEIKYSNKANAIIFGYTAEEVYAWEMQDIVQSIHPEDRQFVLEQLKKKQEGFSGTVHHYQYRCIKKNGEVIWVDNYSKSITYSGKPADFVTLVDITEQKQAEEALKESEEKYRLLVDNLEYLLTMYDIEGNIILINIAGARNFDLEPSDVIGRSLSEFFPDTFEVYLERARRIFNSGQGFEVEDEVQLPTGKGWFRSNIQPIRDSNGDIVAIQTISYDITERKAAQEALKESEERYRRLADNASDMIWTTDMDLRFTYVSPSVHQSRGYTPEEAMGQSLDQVLTPESLDIAMRTFNQEFKLLKESGISRPVTLEFEQYCKDGSTILTQDKMSFIYDSDGEAIGILGVTRDISERKLAEEALRESEEKYRNVVERANDLIVVIQDEVIQYANPLATTIIGYTAEEALGQSLAVFVHPDELPKAFDRYKKRMAGEDVPTIYETALLHKDGQKVEVELSGGIISYKGRAADLIIIRDITERKLAEEKEREAEKLREVDRLRTELLSNVSHELRTPLTTIKGYALMLADYDDRLESEEKKEYLGIIDASSDRMNELVSNLLEMSRLESGMLQLERRSADISKLVQSAVADAQIRFRGHIMISDVSGGPLRANIDAKRIRQVVDNILDNAAKYSQKGTSITIKALQSNSEVLISVTDEGDGIPTDEVEKIFERMYRVDRHQTGRVGGAGLGLSISKGIVEAHGGSIWMESEEGKGSTCSFMLPLKREDNHGIEN